MSGDSVIIIDDPPTNFIEVFCCCFWKVGGWRVRAIAFLSGNAIARLVFVVVFVVFGAWRTSFKDR